MNCPEKAMKISHFNPNQSAPSIYIMIELCYFSLDQWEIRIHLLWGKSFNIPHHCDPHLNQTKFNDLLPLTIPGVLACPSSIHFCLQNGCTLHVNLNSASQPLAELESWTMRPADCIWHFHSFWRINLREKLICSKLDGDRGHFPWKWRCSHFLMENRKASQGGK